MGFPPLTTTATLAALAPRQSSLDHDGTPPVAALTTVWTAAEGCYPVSTRPATDIDMFWTSNPDCAPPGYASYFETYYYSPAICPSGFTVGCARYGDFQGPDVEPTETAMLCVMSDYFCTPGDWNYYATNTDLSYAQIMIEIRWAESDLSILETHPLTPGLILAGETSGTRTGTGAETTQTGPSSTVTVLSGDSSSGGGLPAGAQVGIGVGVGLFGLLGLGLAIFFILRYRRKRRDANQPPVQQLPPGQHPHPSQQYPYMPGPGQQGQHGQSSQGYPPTAYSGYTTYVDPKTGAVTYYSAVPHPTELGGTAIGGSGISHSRDVPSIAVSQPSQERDSIFSSKPPMTSTVSPTGEDTGALPNDVTAGNPALAEMPGSEGTATSTGGTENPQSQQEMATLMAEQAKLEARRTRLMELAELDEEEQRIRLRLQQLQQTQ
ncbi:hypothetical protein F4820DRAFT_447005 [Hypoxylon rubiginosum]|uniref:Uncharacterized protein n=1 Tax=Hypoxylon rubiginosum TaxID=110542 RepID=A0ACB9Z3W9_9PEZI|nr:hypothetical protein F4820DRAFT_447005 [Hypoxylon rubiginosum]